MVQVYYISFKNKPADDILLLLVHGRVWEKNDFFNKPEKQDVNLEKNPKSGIDFWIKFQP